MANQVAVRDLAGKYIVMCMCVLIKLSYKSVLTLSLTIKSHLHGYTVTRSAFFRVELS